MRRENVVSCSVSSPANGSAEWPPDDRLRRVTQYSRDANDRTEKPRRTGSPAFAEDDSLGLDWPHHRTRPTPSKSTLAPMVNRVLTSPYLWWFDRSPLGSRIP